MSFVRKDPEPTSTHRFRVSPARQYDGMVSSDSTGHLYRVYEPAWWQVWRWLALPFKSPRGRIDLNFMGRTISVRIVGERRLTNPFARPF